MFKKQLNVLGLTFDALLYFKFMGTLVISWCLVQDQEQVYTTDLVHTIAELSVWHTEVHFKRVLSTKENRYRKVQLVIPALLQSRTKLLGKVSPSCPLSHAAKLFPKRVTFPKRKPLSSVQCCFLQTPSDQGWVALSMVSFNHWLSSIKTNTLPRY